MGSRLPVGHNNKLIAISLTLNKVTGITLNLQLSNKEDEMKKTLIASAVAAATLSSTAFAMDPASDLAARLDSMPTIYGNIQLAWANETVDVGGANGETSTNEFGDNGSTIGFKHTHAISDGLEGFFKAEFHFDADETGNGANPGLGEKLDEAYIGVKGDFGSVQAGTDDTVYEWVDVLDMYEYAGLEGELASDKEGDNIQYVSPSFSGLTVGATIPVDSDSNFGGQIAAKYGMDNIEAVLAYSIGRDEGTCPDSCTSAGDAIGLAVSVGIDDLTLSAQYETKDESVSNAKDSEDMWGLLANYGMGANNFALGYAIVTEENGGGNAETDTSGIYFQALHNLSDHMYVYLEYLTTTEEDDDAATEDVDTDTLAIGATYAF